MEAIGDPRRLRVLSLPWAIAAHRLVAHSLASDPRSTFNLGNLFAAFGGRSRNFRWPRVSQPGNE
jgi:hypothetical protein